MLNSAESGRAKNIIGFLDHKALIICSKLSDCVRLCYSLTLFIPRFNLMNCSLPTSL
jgi:hypothetical protein